LKNKCGALIHLKIYIYFKYYNYANYKFTRQL